MNENIVFASGLSKRFEVENVAIDVLCGLDLTVKSGEFICLCGPSGAGKTTFLNIIAGLDKATSGDIFVFDHNLKKYDEDFLAAFRSAYVGFVFQSYNLISTLTALENIAFVIELAGWKNDKIKHRSEQLLDLVGLSHRANHFPAQLSGGERQRIALARALANDPPLLLADEPTGNLDAETSNVIWGILEKTKKDGKTVIVATHDQKLLKLSSRAFCLRDGRLTSK